MFWVLIATCTTIVALVLTGCPRLARLLFRHRLECIRDDGVDAVLDGRLRQSEPVRTFLRAMDLIATHARWVTLARGVALVSGLRDLGANPGAQAAACDCRGLPAGERQIMAELEARVEAAFRSYLIWGSPAGWVITPLVTLAGRVRPGGKIAKTEDALPVIAREAVRADPANYPKTARWVLRSQHG
jgi:hypothetical protein